MMSRPIGMAFALTAVMAAPAVGGIITFTPLDGVETLDDPLRFQIGYGGWLEGGGFTEIALHIGVDGGPLVEFEFGDLDFTLQSIDPSNRYESGVLINAVDFGGGTPYAIDNIGIATVYPESTSGEFYLQGHVKRKDMIDYNPFIRFMTGVPETGTLSLLALGAVMMMLKRRQSVT